MKKFISVRLASNLIITVLIIALGMHVLILSNVLPYDFIWGGRVESRDQLLILESISISIQLVFIFIIAVKAGYIFKGRLKRTTIIGTWVMCGVMILNTLGNLASTSSVETIFMTPLTILMAILAFRLAID